MAEVIGRFTCAMGGRGTIQQTKRKGNHFLTRCTCCGFNQGTGAERQQWIWDNAEWLGAAPQPPVNVKVGTKAAAETTTEPEAETLAEFDPFEPEEVTEAANQGGGSGRGRKVAAVASLAAIGGLIYAIARA